MNQVTKYQRVTRTATTDKGMCNRDKVLFHYFNPNGAVQKKRDMDECLATFVDAGVIPAGWHLAYGTFNDYHVKELEKLLDKRRVRSFPARYHAKRILEEVESTYIKLGEAILADES